MPQAEDLRWAADVRHPVQLTDLALVGQGNSIEVYLLAEPALGAVLWIDPAGPGKQLNCLWVFGDGSSTTRLQGRRTRHDLPRSPAQQPAVQARFRVGQRGPAPATAAVFATLAPFVAEDAAFGRSPSGRRQAQQALELARERQESLRELLTAQAEARQKEFECCAEEIEEQLEALLDASAEFREAGLEAVRDFPRRPTRQGSVRLLLARLGLRALVRRVVDRRQAVGTKHPWVWCRCSSPVGRRFSIGMRTPTADRKNDLGGYLCHLSRTVPRLYDQLLSVLAWG
jgi:hypothetical protein